jgi:polyisoprenoid-binding protein YceI
MIRKRSYILGLALAISFSAFRAEAQPAAGKASVTTPAAAQSKNPANPASVPGAKQTVDLAKSSVSAVFKQTGVSTEGQFRKFNISVEFDPANPAQTKAQVDIDTASFDIGDPAYNAELVKKEWFNAAQYPKANFVSTTVKSIAPGKLEASGKLTLKGKTVDLVVPVTYRQEGSNVVFDGSIPIKRLAFKIGEGEWADTSVLDDEVRIKFKVTLVSGK